MLQYPISVEETARLAALKSFNILDSAPEEEIDALVKLAQRLLNVPVAMVTLLDKDRQWIKAGCGVDVTEVDRKLTFCTYAILQEKPLVVRDARLDPRFASNPLVADEPHIRSYAGANLRTEQGYNLGTLCVMDFQPRNFSTEQIFILKELAALVMRLIERRNETQRLVKIEQAFKQITLQALSINGTDLFKILMSYLSRFLDVAYVGVSTFLPVKGRMKATAYLKDGEIYTSDIEYEAAGTPAETTLDHGHFYSTNALLAEFPEVKEFVAFKLTSYAGITIYDTHGSPLAVLGVLDNKPLVDTELIKNLLDALGVRISAELQRVRLEEELSLSEHRYRTLAETANDAIISVDSQSNILYVNPTAQKMFGYDWEELIGQCLTVLMPPAVGAYYTEAINKYLLTGERTIDWSCFELLGLHRDGMIIPMEISVGEARLGSNSYFTAVIRDITSRKQMLTALRHSEEQYRTLASNYPNGVVILYDKDQRIKVAGGLMFREFGFNSENLEGRTLQECFPLVINQFEEHSKHTLKGGIDTYELEYMGKIFSVNSQALLNEKGEFYAGMAVAHDVTPQRTAQREIERALTRERELRELKTRFISMTSHELRSPLTGIMINANLLESKGNRVTEEKRNQYFERIRNSVNTMTAMVDEVLLIGQAEENRQEVNRQKIQLEAFCRELVEGFNPPGMQVGPVINFEWKSKFDGIISDKKLLEHIIQNLLSNAWKYSPNTSKIDFRVKHKRDRVVIEVQDYGIGIPQKDLTDLFEPFHRASNVDQIPGTGLGLSIVKQFVELLDGSIEVQSKVGKGTTFRVCLPVITGPATAKVKLLGLQTVTAQV